jgi:signal transduction histidine kinase/DNA-binding response OmpR family regulator
MIARGKILRRLKIFFALMVLVAIASSCLLFLSQNQQSNYLSKVSLSSRQKALAEELGRKMVTIKDLSAHGLDYSEEANNFKLVLNKWENAQKALITGSDQYGTTANNSNASQAMLQESSVHFVHARDELTMFIEAPDQMSVGKMDSTEMVLDTYIGSINNVTGKFLSESDSLSKAMLAAAIGVGVSALLLFLMTFLLLVKPVSETFDVMDDELEKSEAKIKEALNAKTEFLSNMSHEVRTPLNGVIGMSELLLQTKLVEEQRVFAKNIHTSALQLLDLLNNVLDVAKMQSSKSEVIKERFSLSDCIEQVVDLMKPLALSKKIELMSDYQSNVPLEVVGDENRIRQILINLVNNAIKFTEKGEVVIRSEVINTEQEFAQLEFSVVDSGIGIAQKQLDRIFDSFYQVDSSSHKKYGGSGLGLAICQSLAQELGSKIKVQSTEGKGSTFSFSVVVETSGEAHQQKIQALRGLRALVIDDNTTNLKILVKQLSGWGIQATPFNSPQLVTDIMSNLDKFDFVILDMQMPEMDGQLVAEKIRSKYSRTELPIIVLSSLGEHLLSDNNNLYNAYLTKPAKQFKLLDTIIDVLKVSPQQQARLSMSTGNVDVLATKSNLRILLAQDNELSRAVTTKTLELLGHRHITVSNMKDVLEKSRREDFDLILMDINEQENIGLDTTRNLKRSIDADDMPVIIGMTNKSQKENAQFIQAGMDDVVETPTRAEALQKKINHWLITE